MKTPLYETSGGALKALLATRQFVFCDLYTFTLFGGGVLRYATADVGVTYGGTLWPGNSTLFDTAGSSAKAHWKIGMDTDTWQIQVMPRAVDPVTGAAYPDRIGNQPWLAAARVGALDGATVQIDRAYLPAWPSYTGVPVAPAGVITIFAGRVAEVDIGRDGASLTINSHIELLGTATPRNLYQASCRFTLFDTGCSLAAASYAVSGTASSAAGATLNGTFATPGGTTTYALGRVAFTSGANTGITRLVRSWSSGVLTLAAPFPYAVTSGDTFTLWPGCAKTQAACATFGNSRNFGGMPYIPAPETAV